MGKATVVEGGCPEKEQLDRLLEAVKENNQKKSDLNRSFTVQDSLLIDKQKKIQDLLDRLMDSEIKQLLDEFSKLSEEFSKDKFKIWTKEWNLLSIRSVKNWIGILNC